MNFVKNLTLQNLVKGIKALSGFPFYSFRTYNISRFFLKKIRILENKILEIKHLLRKLSVLDIIVERLNVIDNINSKLDKLDAIDSQLDQVSFSLAKLDKMAEFERLLEEILCFSEELSQISVIESRLQQIFGLKERFDKVENSILKLDKIDKRVEILDELKTFKNTLDVDNFKSKLAKIEKLEVLPTELKKVYDLLSSSENQLKALSDIQNQVKRLPEIHTYSKSLSEIGNMIAEMSHLFVYRQKIYNYVLSSHSVSISEINGSSICIDCGGHIGLVSEVFLNLGAEVYTFEPNIYLANLLRFRLSKYIDEGKLHIHNKAVWHENKKIKLFLRENYSNSNITHVDSESSSLIKDKTDKKLLFNTSKNNFLTVDSIDIAEFLKELNKPIHIMKLDIEGAEYTVLDRMIDTGVYKMIKYILVEEHHQKVPTLQPSADKVRKKIQDENITNIHFDWH